MTTKQPNILLIMPDEMRGDCLSLEHHAVLKTPNIDSIGRGGMHFTRAYTTCASCIAARRSMLTGQFPATNGMVGYREGVSLNAPTVTQLLKDAGYATALAGRYMHQVPREEPYGFERRVLGSTYVKDDDYARCLDEQAPELGGIKGIGLSCNGREAKAWPVDEALHPTNWAAQQAQKLLQESEAERPLFLVTSFYAPHSPLFPPARYLDHYLGMDLPHVARGDWETAPSRESFEDNVDASRVDLQGDELRRAQAGYFGLIKQIDDQIADLLDAFKRKSEAEGRPWLIVFTSDHGDMMGDHYLFRKCEPYEGSSRIPFLIQGSPELDFAAGTQCGSPVCLEDIMPTLLEVAGVALPERIDGQSLMHVLRGRAEAVRDVLHGEHATCYDAEQGYHFMTDGRMKYIWRPATGEEQLFDLHVDPQELHNLNESADSEVWRNRMIEQLKERPEGFSDGTRLMAGCTYGPVLPHASGKDSQSHG
ncbi:MAG: sulfatase-like hydrolase/transferase [Verrucomicrobia bacterium]|mgnify:CR=1 FL=1|jgi:arylsulfatase|nr:sulfatase-like hydrolase/transferase [Verrucomicrobiota bacterium]MBT7065705.1 sulfatase-like hydrolase/transferase [Verrucomicrobiota bacterium]MBT7700241.1 sulfatase-like hydrolase/transferase [Verrucomicrobiota bacterium]